VTLDGWTKADVKRLARRFLGERARVWSRIGRVYVGLETPSGQRLIVGTGKSWADLVQRTFVDALRAYDKFKAAGYTHPKEPPRADGGLAARVLAEDD
jgi:hypothetical protein